RDIHNGDSFSILFEEKFLDGQRVSTGNILAAEFINNGKAYRAVRYTDQHGVSDYYTPDGRNLKKRFTRTPVKFTRISSKFTMGRWHPVLHRMRKHQGVDYAAPTGTPVKATANGHITFKGRKGGYGNALVIDHGDHYSTLYGHLSAYSKAAKTGTRIRQGDIIGYVGMSGLATGPHLHYEFLVNGVHRDPLSVKLPIGEPIPPSQLKKFRASSRQFLAHMQTHKQVELAKANHHTHDENKA
ncbi:MAG: M23 family metallopeptidase, partial [Pseudomonadota bacterium]|nr:M23 family metallopeptidase [Pseudomonadota bacterium]